VVPLLGRLLHQLLLFENGCVLFLF
jgi:hypothetical protein